MTKGSNERPVRRVLADRYGDHWVVELRADLILIRPKGSRVGGKAEIAVTPGIVYQRAMAQRVAAEIDEKRALRGIRRKR